MTGPQPQLHPIELVGLTKAYGDKRAVDDLTLRIPAGTTFGFIGPNGAGKTTTIKMLMGMLRSTSGSARILGVDVLKDPVHLKQRVGYVPELHFIYRWMRVRDVIGFCRSLFATWNDPLCDDLIKLFGLDVHKQVKHLSKGTVAKLALLTAVAHEPEVLILDEPTSGLDPLAREEFLDGVLRTMCQEQRTVFYSSHTLSDVQRLAENIGIIYEGRLLAHCSADDLVSGTKRIRAVMKEGCTPGQPPDGTIWQRFDRREWLVTVRGFTPDTVGLLRSKYPVENIEVMDLGLEEVFKDYVKGRRALA